MLARGWWKQHLGLRLVSLAMALGLIVWARLSEVYTIVVDAVEVRAVNPPPNVVLDMAAQHQVSPAFTSIRVSGARKDVIAAAEPRLWRVEVDLQDPHVAPLIRDGSTVVPLREEMVKLLLPGLRNRLQVDVSPAGDTIVVYTSLVTKTVPVVLRLIGEPASGFVISATRVEPGQIRLTGAPATLQTINAVYTEVGNISQLDASLEDIAVLEPPPPGVSLLEGEPTSVRFSVEVRRKR